MTSDAFHLIDLSSQATAVQRHLSGLLVAEKLAWLADRGTLTLAIALPGVRDTFRFKSTIGLDCLFFFIDEKFVFVGDHWTYVVDDSGQHQRPSLHASGSADPD